MQKDLEIYIHIPFCVRKCAYCDFLSAPAKSDTRAHYVKALKTEILRGRPFCTPSWPGTALRNYRVVSVFFGGGTPSLLSPGQIGEIMEALREGFTFAQDAEITMECNPGTIGKKTEHSAAWQADASDAAIFSPAVPCQTGNFRDETARFAAYRACGVNRLSFGLQSADNQELALLGRIHTWEGFLASYQAARAAGFENINVDLMSALPGQTADSWTKTLCSVLRLEPEHISAYSLIIEEGTPFYKRYHEDDMRRAAGETPVYLPSEEEERLMYRQTGALLREHGLQRYEISNYARSGYACRHNIGYWRGTEYMGFGLGAASMLRVSSPVFNRKGQPQSDGTAVAVEAAAAKAAAKAAADEAATPEAFSSFTAQRSSNATLPRSPRTARLIPNATLPRSPRTFRLIPNVVRLCSPRTARLKNTEDLSDYLKRGDALAAGAASMRLCPSGSWNFLTTQDEMEEYMFLGLRLTDGVQEEGFRTRFGVSVDEIYGTVIRRLTASGLLARVAGKIFLTDRGLDLANYVMSEFCF